MALLVEIFMFGVLPIAFAIWQIRDVRREQQKRRIQQANADEGESGEQGTDRQGQPPGAA